MAWMGMLGLPGFLRKERRMRAGTSGCQWLAAESPGYTAASIASRTSTAADGDHEVGFEVIEDAVRRCLAEFMDLVVRHVDLFDHFDG